MSKHARQISMLFSLAVCFLGSISYAHGLGPRGIHSLDWHTEQISQVVAFLPYHKSGYARTNKIEDKRCMTAPRFSINVREEYAYDIDETVEVEIEFDLETSGTNVEFEYDKNGEHSSIQKIKLPEKGESRWHRHTFTLERARFAGRPGSHVGYFVAGDFSIGNSFSGEYVTVCDIILKRSYTTPNPAAYGRLALNLIDEDGDPISARVGLYDATGRMPLPEEEAIPVRYFSDVTQTVNLRPGSVSWPADNRRAFYVDGSYHARLPVGQYKLVVARGLEYRILQQTVEIEPHKETPLVLTLMRWTDMPAKGWYSGDVHIHYGRASGHENVNIRRHTRAEDLHVANLLQMGNIGRTHYWQYQWGEEGRFGEAPYVLVPGQEDPRTRHRGHTIQLNLDAPIRNPERYYLYHEVFAEVRKQGGMTGYAHAGTDDPGTRFGMALDVPFDLVDFFEVLQAANAGVGTWFEFLNLGYKLSPTAGTDFPYSDMPGTVRSYVEVGKEFSVQGWFDGLTAGRTFVTNGPMLEFAVNDRGMGSEVRVKKGAAITIEARASLNPDIDRLHSMELIQQGVIVASISSKTGAEELRLDHETQANQGSWFVLRAQGKRAKPRERNSRISMPPTTVVAVSAPIYVTVDGNGFCKLSAVASLVSEQKEELQKGQDQNVIEAWDTWEPQKKYWPSNRLLLEKRIEEVNRTYDELVALAAEGRCITE